ncbi:MAG: TldD/PmbA family protein [Candidatus Aegiribacteria sp.]|nr:TldD/PmbA family protein [Candidatus Aegiribacteria sp.]
MKDRRDITEYCVEALRKAGLQKSECLLLDTLKDELNIDSGEISLLRTIDNTSLTLTGILDDKEGTISINKIDRQSIDDAVCKVLELAESSEADSANDISPAQPAAVFEKGPETADLDLMYSRMKDFMIYSGEHYPSLILKQAILDFMKIHKYYRNSNGVELQSSRSCYSFIPVFVSKEGTEISSFNYAFFSTTELERDLHEYGTINVLMNQSTEQIHSKEFQDKFDGDIIITPDCLGSFINMIAMYLGDYPMIKGTSIFKDSLGREIADPQLTLHSMPLSDELAKNCFVTDDGFTARNSTIISKGVLKSFLLSLYGANKTGETRSVSDGDAYVIDPGEYTLDEMTGSVDRGILLCRFSGSRPSESGDFSGVAKNSYYIENGEVKYPVKEIMISGNLKSLLSNIKRISRERVNFGDSILPWIQAGDITIFGK